LINLLLLKKRPEQEMHCNKTMQTNQLSSLPKPLCPTNIPFRRSASSPFRMTHTLEENPSQTLSNMSQLARKCPYTNYQKVRGYV
jgi:hypothetical protein